MAQKLEILMSHQPPHLQFQHLQFLSHQPHQNLQFLSHQPPHQHLQFLIHQPPHQHLQFLSHQPPHQHLLFLSHQPPHRPHQRLPENQTLISVRRAHQRKVVERSKVNYVRVALKEEKHDPYPQSRKSMKLLSAPLSLILFCSSIRAGHASVLSHTSVLDMVEDVNTRPNMDINDRKIQYADNNECIRKGNRMSPKMYEGSRMSSKMYDISTESCMKVEDGWDFKRIEKKTYVIKLKGTELCLGGSSDKVILSKCADPPRSQSQTWNIISEDDTKPVRFLNKVAK